MFSLALTADPALGRVDYNSLTDQTLMEMLADGFDEATRKRYQDSEGLYLDIADWLCARFDDDENVIDIKECRNTRGSLHLHCIPPNVRKFVLTWQKLEGSIDLAILPKNIECLILAGNELTGSIDLSRLPNRLRLLALNSNRFTGSIDLTQLPHSMEDLNVAFNRLSGSLNFDTLPAKLHTVRLQNNAFTGTFNAPHLPPDLQTLNASRNKFSESAVVDSQTTAEIDIFGSGVTSVVDENGNAVVGKMQI